MLINTVLKEIASNSAPSSNVISSSLSVSSPSPVSRICSRQKLRQPYRDSILKRYLCRVDRRLIRIRHLIELYEYVVQLFVLCCFQCRLNENENYSQSPITQSFDCIRACVFALVDGLMDVCEEFSVTGSRRHLMESLQLFLPVLLASRTSIDSVYVNPAYIYRSVGIWI